MPTLDEEEQGALKRQAPGVCGECHQRIRKNNCRSCAEYFQDGHLPTCSQMGPDTRNNHQGHRTY